MLVASFKNSASNKKYLAANASYFGMDRLMLLESFISNFNSKMLKIPLP